MKTLITLLAVVGAVTLGGLVASAQGGRPGRPGGAGIDNQDAGVSPVEVQRMFDAYALMQAQEQLKISDEQFAQFLTRYKALQDIRRRALQEHARIVVELRRMLNGNPAGDDGTIRDRVKSLDDIESRQAADIKKAYEAIDQILDIRQQAKFRIFEESMERRKLELVTRARQANRPKL